MPCLCSAPPAWWSAIPNNTRVRPWLALPDRDPGLAVRVALVFGPRTNQTVVAVLLQHVRRPAAHPAHRENALGEPVQLLVARALAQFFAQHAQVRGPRIFRALGEPVQLLVARALAQFFA